MPCIDLLKMYFWTKYMNMNIPADLLYTKDHEWVRVENGVATIGVTDFAQGELGDVVYVEVETEGESLAEEEVFGTIEAVKTVSDLFMPLAGEVLEFNSELESAPETVNSDAYGAGWIIKVKLESDDTSNLLSADQYKELVG